MQKKPLTPGDWAVLMIIVAIYVGVVAVFVWLFMDGTSPAFHKCGYQPCPFTMALHDHHHAPEMPLSAKPP